MISAVVPTLAFLAVPIAATAAQEPQLLRLSLLPGQVQWYCQGTDVKIRMDVGGKPVATALTFELTIEARTAAVKDGKADLDQTVRRVRVKVDNPRLQVDYDSDQPDAEGRSALLLGGITSLPGKTFRMTLDERGRISDVAVPAGVDATVTEALGTGDLGRFFAWHLPLLPERPLAVGGSWESRTAMALGHAGTVDVKVQSRLAKVDGSKVTIEHTLQLETAQLDLPRGTTMELQKAGGSTLLDLTGGAVISETTLQLRLKGAQGGLAMDSDLVLTMRRQAIEGPKVERPPVKGKG